VLPLRKASRREEQQMAAWIDQNVPAVTAKYVDRERKGV
jgi:hypothetical protein